MSPFGTDEGVPTSVPTVHSYIASTAAHPVRPAREAGVQLTHRTVRAVFVRGPCRDAAMPPVARARRGRNALVTFEGYGEQVTEAEVTSRILGALEHRVLTPANPELRGYFAMAATRTTSPFGGTGDDDAISKASDQDIEQTALLFCHYDADGDGVLNYDEFAAVVELVSAQTGMSLSGEHVDRCFRTADVDSSGGIDLNELLLYRATSAHRQSDHNCS